MQQALRALTLTVCVTAAVTSQTKPPVSPADYGQFEALSIVQNGGGLSPDGTWLAYGINRSNRNNELRVVSIATGATTTAAFGAQPTFAADSRWVAYSIGLSESEQDRLRKDKKPIHNRLGLLDLTSGQTAVVDAIESFAFSANGSDLAMPRSPPEKKDAPAADGAGSVDSEDAPQGATLIVRHLATMRDTTFGNVSEFAWQDKGRLLAMTISVEDK